MESLCDFAAHVYIIAEIMVLVNGGVTVYISLIEIGISAAAVCSRRRSQTASVSDKVYYYLQE